MRRLRLVFALVVLSSVLLVLPPWVSRAAGPGYLTILFGRTQYVSSDGSKCVPLPDTVDLDQVAVDLSARGLVGVGNVIAGRTPESGLGCSGDGLSLHPSWEWMRQRQQEGWRFVSAGANYRDMTALSHAARVEESCGSLATFSAHGLVGASGMFAYPNDRSTTAIQEDPVSTCFDFGRKYGPGVTVAPGVVPWFASTISVNGGNCNDATQACYTFAAPRRYASPVWLASLMDVAPGGWLNIQFYRFVTGAHTSAGSSWDCTSADWRRHWVSRTELYCYADFLTVMDAARAAANGGVIVTDPHTVALAWGRSPGALPSPTPSPSPTSSARRPDAQIAVAGGSWIGDDVYDATGRGQSIGGLTVPRGASVTFTWRIQNDGSAWDRVTLRASAGGSSNLWVRFTIGSSDVTGMAVAGTLTRSLAPGASVTVSFRLTIGTRAEVGLVRSDLLTVTSQEPGLVDTVGTSITVI